MGTDFFRWIQPFDTRIAVAVSRMRNQFLNRFFTFLTHTGTGNVYFPVALILLLLSWQHIEWIPSQMLFVNCMVSALLGWFSSSQLKKVFERDRPHADQAIISLPSCRSFPSGHSASAIGFFVALAVHGHPAAIGVFIWATLISFSRVYLGVHWASDVMGGTVLGVICGLLSLIWA